MKTTKQEKYLEYAIKIQSKIAELFDEDNESDYYINKDDFNDDDNITQFIHALSNTVPTNLYNKLTGDSVNCLDFNHIANKLVFQYSKKTT